MIVHVDFFEAFGLAALLLGFGGFLVWRGAARALRKLKRKLRGKASK